MRLAVEPFGEPRKKQPPKKTTPLKKQPRIYPEKNNHIKKTTVSLSRKKTTISVKQP